MFLETQEDFGKIRIHYPKNGIRWHRNLGHTKNPSIGRAVANLGSKKYMRPGLGFAESMGLDSLAVFVGW